MTAQPKPTAADVLREHWPRELMWEHECAAGDFRTKGGKARDFAQHQADMLAAAGLLATAEHDAQVLRDAAEAWLGETPPGGGVDDWGRGWLACRDAIVYDLGTARPDRIAAGGQP